MSRNGSSTVFALFFIGVNYANMLKLVRFWVDFDLEAPQIKSLGAVILAADRNQGHFASDGDIGALLVDPTAVGHNQTGLCSRDEIILGSWVPVEEEHPPYIPKNSHLRCYPEEIYTKTPWNTYHWMPHSKTCNLSEWNSADFCSLMNFGTVLIAGDSLSWEQYSSLGQLLGLRIHQSSQLKSKANQGNHIQFGCRQYSRQTRLVFRRDDILTNLESAIMDAFPQVIVINRGAHFQNDTAFTNGMHQLIQNIMNWKEKCADYGLKCHLFWRTSVPGHPLCNQTSFTQPNNDLEAMEAWIDNRSNYDEHTIQYHWYDYQHQNNLALDMLRQGLGEDSFEVLDAYFLNVLRPDEHRSHQGDCLHNCYPGKMDVYNQLLLHYLRVQRTQEDVDDLAHRAATARAALGATKVVNGTLATQVVRH